MLLEKTRLELYFKATQSSQNHNYFGSLVCYLVFEMIIDSNCVSLLSFGWRIYQLKLK